MQLSACQVATRAGQVSVHRVGGGQPVLLVHGFLFSHHCFADIVPTLASRNEVILVDLPGFGASDCPPTARFSYDVESFASILEEVIEALDIRGAVLLGHSLGGGAALRLAIRRSDRLRALVLVSAAVYALPLPFEALVVTLPLVGHFLWMHAFTRWNLRWVLRRHEVCDPHALSDQLLDECWANLVRAGGKEAAFAALQTLHGLTDEDDTPEQVRLPTLLIWGGRDRAVPLIQGERLKRCIPGAQLRILPSAGHLPFLEDPQAFLQQLEPFLSSDGAAATS